MSRVYMSETVSNLLIYNCLELVLKFIPTGT